MLYVDRNGNGDLTEKDERVTCRESHNFRSFAAGDIHDGALVHTGLTVTEAVATPEYVGNEKEFKRIKAQNVVPLIWTVRVAAERPAQDKRPLPKHIGYVVNGDGLGFLVFGKRPEEAPVIHFNGPWSLGLQDIRGQLTAGEKFRFMIGVGTQGHGPGTFAFVFYPNTIPNDAYPVAEITFPPKDPDQKPKIERVTLTKRC